MASSISVVHPWPRYGELCFHSTHYKDAAEVRTLVRNQLIAGAEVVFAFVQARYPMLDLELITMASVDLHPYYPVVKHPAAIVIDRLERGTEVDLQVRAERRAGRSN